MHLHRHIIIDAFTSQLFTELTSKSDYDPKNFRGVAIDDSHLVWKNDEHGVRRLNQLSERRMQKKTS